ncbi:MAG: DUF177 domain-containing protein [Candidatus Omnitrophica bacterium]|nr:DUF177 domain-containing protein [Candidatus Omnitrophota bacterium]
MNPQLLIQFDSVPNSGLVLHRRYEGPSLDMDTSICAFAGPFELEARIEIEFGEASIETAVRGETTCTCNRCAREFSRHLEREFRFVYDTRETPEVDLLEAVREELLLGSEIQLLCSEGCKGLCPTCGQDLNQMECSCVLEETEPRGLSGLKLGKEKSHGTS